MNEVNGPGRKGEEPLSERNKPSGSVEAGPEREAAGPKASPGPGASGSSCLAFC